MPLGCRLWRLAASQAYVPAVRLHRLLMHANEIMFQSIILFFEIIHQKEVRTHALG